MIINVDGFIVLSLKLTVKMPPVSKWKMVLLLKISLVKYEVVLLKMLWY